MNHAIDNADKPAPRILTEEELAKAGGGASENHASNENIRNHPHQLSLRA